MAVAKTSGSFVFIDQSDDAITKVKGAKRKAIRKQAMRDAGLARRERGGHGRVNSRQLPIFMGSVGNLDEVRMNVDFTREQAEGYRKQAMVNFKTKAQILDAICRVPPTVPPKGYDRLRMEYGFDILSLSPLTTVHFSRAVAAVLANDPHKLQKLILQPVKATYLHHIPARYDESPLLQKVTKWAIAQGLRVFNPYTNITEERALVLLDDVLHELQSALSDNSRRYASDTLCASHILAMLLMLEKHENPTWTPFATGAGHILQLRGPDAFNTEFDQSMLISYLGFAFIDNLSKNTDCFLEGKQWTKKLRAVAVNSPPESERYELIIELWTLVFPIPRLFRMATDCILCEEGKNDPEQRFQIIFECYAIRDHLLQWRDSYSQFVRTQDAYNNGDFKAREFTGISSACLLLVDRCILALEPLSVGARGLEKEVQRMVDVIAKTHEEAQHLEDWQCDVLMARKLLFARAARETSKGWAKALEGDPAFLSQQGTISKELYTEWRDHYLRPGYLTSASSTI